MIKFINRANLLSILVSALGLLAFASWHCSPNESRPALDGLTFEPTTFLEEWWKGGQGKGFRYWGDAPQAGSLESIAIRRLIADRADLEFWSEREITELSRYILAKSQEFQMSPFFVLSLIEVESGYRSAVISNRGAVGLLQLLPATAEEVAVNSGMIWRGSAILVDPKTNIDLGLRYMTILKRQFGEDKHTLTAYNMGPYALQKKLNMGEKVSYAYFERVMQAFSSYKKKAKLPPSRSRKWATAWL